MVKKKTTAKKARTRTVYRTAPRKRAVHHKSGYDKIPSAMATLALGAVNIEPMKYAVESVSSYGVVPVVRDMALMKNRGLSVDKKFLNKDQIVKDAVAIAGGYVAGEIFNKFAPGIIKRPAGKLAKKIPKVI